MKIRDLSHYMMPKHDACIFDNDIKNRQLKWKKSRSAADAGYMAHDAYEAYQAYQALLGTRSPFYSGTTTNTNQWEFIPKFTNSWV